MSTTAIQAQTGENQTSPAFRMLESLNVIRNESAQESRISFQLCLQGALGRQEQEAFIAKRFNDVYGAQVDEFYPVLMSRTENNSLSSVVGIRPGTDKPLFLEQYLELPLDEAIHQKTGNRVCRNTLAEIGNLASNCRRSNQLMFIILTAVLAEAGYEWVVFTATSQVRALLRRLKFYPVTLCGADPTRLHDNSDAWGSYYAAGPEVQSGSLKEGMEILRQNPFTAGLLKRHELEIRQLARQLQNKFRNR